MANWPWVENSRTIFLKFVFLLKNSDFLGIIQVVKKCWRFLTSARSYPIFWWILSFVTFFHCCQFYDDCFDSSQMLSDVIYSFLLATCTIQVTTYYTTVAQGVHCQHYLFLGVVPYIGSLYLLCRTSIV